MLTLLAFGTLWFWFVSAITFLVIVALVENEKEVQAGFLLIGSLAAFYFLGNHGMLGWVVEHPIILLWWVLGYLGVACIWAIFKWTLFVHNESNKYQEVKARFLKENEADKKPAELKAVWAEYAERGSYGGRSFLFPAPEANDFKGKIVGWMTYWPWSAFWTILNDPIRKLMRFLYNRIAGLLNKISNHAYKNTSDDIFSGPIGKRKG